MLLDDEDDIGEEIERYQQVSEQFDNFLHNIKNEEEIVNECPLDISENEFEYIVQNYISYRTFDFAFIASCFALKKFPYSSMLTCFKCYSLISKGKIEDALNTLDEYVAIYPINANILLHYCFISTKKEDFESAKVYFKNAKKDYSTYNPELYLIINTIAGQCIYKHRYNDAIYYLNESVRLAKKIFDFNSEFKLIDEQELLYNYHIDYAHCYSELGYKNLAIENLKSAINIFPLKNSTWTLLAEAYSDIDENKAIEMAKYALALSKNDETAILFLAKIYYKNKKYDFAEKYFKKYVAYVPEHHLDNSYLEIYIDVLMLRNNYREAHKTLKILKNKINNNSDENEKDLEYSNYILSCITQLNAIKEWGGEKYLEFIKEKNIKNTLCYKNHLKYKLINFYKYLAAMEGIITAQEINNITEYTLNKLNTD